MSVEMSETGLPELFAAMAKAQGAMTGAAKDGVAEGGTNRARSYATLQSALEAVRGPLAANGLAVLQPVERDGENVLVSTMIVHSGGGWMRWTMSASTAGLQQRGVQAVGATVTYLRRYTLMAACGIAPDDDDDGQSNADAARQERRPERREERPEPQRSQPVAKGQKHPEWQHASPWFFAQLNDLGVDYKTQLAPWHEKEHGSRPSQLPRWKLEELVRHLQSDAGRGLVQWLREQGGAA